MSLGSWDPTAESAAGNIQIDSATLERLITYSREQQLSELEHLIASDERQLLAGLMKIDSSPVIPLAKTLRQRGARLDKDLLRWLREVNNNRFLPYGPL